MNYSLMTEREVEIELSTSVSEGLSSFTAHDRLIDNGQNTPEKSYARSVMSVVLSQLTNLYTIAFIAMGVIAALCDFKGSMAAWIMFFAVAAINVVSGFLRDNGNRKLGAKFDKRRAAAVKVIRDGSLTEIMPALIVKGDIVQLEAGDFVPADIRILKCENLRADETMFRGRSVPVSKKSERVEDGDEIRLDNVLYCGSCIASGSCLGAVVAVGKDTVLARLNKEKSEKLDMHNKFGTSAVSEKLLSLSAVVLAIVVLIISVVKAHSFNQAMLYSCTAALCLLPAPLSIVREIALMIEGRRINRDYDERLDLWDCAFNLGECEYLIFDKGGILTEGEMRLEEKAVSAPDDVKMAVICSDCEFTHSLVFKNEMDRATAVCLEAEGVDVSALMKQNERILFMPFDESRKLMAVLIRHESGYRLIVKGAVDTLPTLCESLSDKGNIINMNGEIMHRLETISSSMAERGLKMRAIAYRDIDFVPENIESEIKSLIFAGILGYRVELTGNVEQLVKNVKDVYVKPVMITGDHIVTAETIAKNAGLIENERECISARDLDGADNSDICKACEKYSVIATANATDRERIVRALAENGAKVSVAGEEMTAPDVSVYASAVLADGGADKVFGLLYRARVLRENLAYATLMAISIGISEALVILFMLLTGEANMPAAAKMLALNLCVAFLPSLAVCLYARRRYMVKRRHLLAPMALLQGTVCAIVCILSGSTPVEFVALYAPIMACVAIGLGGNIKRPAGLICTLAMALAALVVLKLSFAAAAVAVLAVLINIGLEWLDTERTEKHV